MSDWQPIETAPKDGSKVLVWDADWKEPRLVSWAVPDGPYSEDECWCTPSEGPGYNSEVENATHWQPLPPPPA